MVADPNSPAAAVGAQRPYEIGKTSADNVAAYLSGQQVPPFTFVPAVLVTKKNAATTAKPLLDDAARIGGK
jgi:ribose transport system substrate-binding protein